ncbi:MAG: hypothetical protein IPK58_00595 [Acidobacteria bacterium]|nr:hypothetical protein [Acidobacteriota bacterium]
MTEIEVGYWLDKSESAIIESFAAGDKLLADVDPELIRKMASCGIVTTSELLDAREKQTLSDLERARIQYQRNKYVVIRELLPAAQMAAMRRYYRQYVENGFMPFDDAQSARFYQHNEPLARFFHQNLAKLMTLVIGREVIPSYVYAGAYIEGSELNPHTDRAQCEFSISFQVDYFPEPDNHISPWGLFLEPPDFDADGPFEFDCKEFPAANQAEDKNIAVYLKSGDGLIYKGRELIHYRYALPKGHRSTSLFFHYVASDFSGGLD